MSDKRKNTRRLFGLGVMGLLGMTLLACVRSIDITDHYEDSDEPPADPAPSPYPQTAGFARLEAREVTINTYGLSTSGVVPTAEMFYAFIPADEDAARKPVIVIFSGGPGAATSSMLTTFGTAPYAMDWKGNFEIVPNPGSLTAAGNLLYIDARQTGFSYEVGLPETRPDGFIDYGSIYNIFTDASDIILTLLEVLADRPVLQDNPVVIMGESFGGARATMMLDLLNHPEQLSQTNTAFRDTRLLEAIEAHFGAVFKKTPFASLTSAQTRTQFGWQVLIQPGLILDVQNYMYVTCGNIDPNDFRAPFCAGIYNAYDIRVQNPDIASLPIDEGAARLLTRAGFETFFGIPPETVPGLPATDRQQAARPWDGVPLEDIVPDSDWLSTLGALPSRDRYHIPLLFGVFDTFSVAPACTARFIRNIAEVNTFITNALFDSLVASDKIPEAILLASAAMTPPPVSEAWLDMSAIDDGVARPGTAFVTFNESNGLGVAAGTRRIRMPIYDDSGHSVPMYQAEAFKDDVIDFLAETGAYDVAASL